MVNLKGRENLYKKEAVELIRRFQNDVGEVILFCYFHKWLCSHPLA
jgi:hypothetical protein